MMLFNIAIGQKSGSFDEKHSREQEEALINIDNRNSHLNSEHGLQHSQRRCIGANGI